MKKLIDKWKLNKRLLASKMNMTSMTFGNKLKNNSFDEKELIQLRMVLRELYTDLDSAIEIDFNDAVKVILTQNII